MKRFLHNRSWDEHRRAVRNARPEIDSKPPALYWHLCLKLKKLKIEEERLALTERENRILVEKIVNIMRSKGHIDNINNAVSMSLNHGKREQENLRIKTENMNMIKRINEIKPTISR